MTGTMTGAGAETAAEMLEEKAEKQSSEAICRVDLAGFWWKLEAARLAVVSSCAASNWLKLGT
jgi:hypothetical protein